MGRDGGCEHLACLVNGQPSRCRLSETCSNPTGTSYPPTDVYRKQANIQDWTIQSRSHCYDGRLGSVYDTLLAAQTACASDAQCNGVYDIGCDGATYHACDRSIAWDTSGSSCIHIKPEVAA